MPTLYVDRPLLDVVRDRKERLERQDGVDYVSEREALETMFDEKAENEIQRARD